MIIKINNEKEEEYYKWDKVYFIRKIIEINGVKYKIIADWVWRKRIITNDLYSFYKYAWIYSLEEPPKECL